MSVPVLSVDELADQVAEVIDFFGCVVDCLIEFLVDVCVESWSDFFDV